MRQAGRSLKDYPDIQLPNTDELVELGNRLINEELNYDRDLLRNENQAILINLNPEQKNAYDAIMHSVDNGLGKQIFVDGYVEQGKHTYGSQ
jgi:ATP-dependent DNA helicase PIF1